MFTLPTRVARTPARRVSRPLYAYATLEEFVLLYPFYAVLFADTGLSVAQITSLFVIWSATAIVLEVPSGALADIVSRRLLLACAPIFAATAFALWLIFPSYWSFAFGFVLWGAGGTLSSGALEALVYTELDTRGAAQQYARIMGVARSCGVVAVGVSTVIAVPVMALGGYAAIGAASVLVCLMCAASALLLPETRTAATSDIETEPAYFRTLSEGLREIRQSRPVLAAVALAAVVPALWESLEEYVPLLAVEDGVRVELVPWVVLVIWIGVAAGGLCAGAGARLHNRSLAVLVAAGAGLMALGALAGSPFGWIALGAAFGVFQMTSVVADARLQHRITGPSRATVTSVAGLGTGLLTVAAFLAYAGLFSFSGHAWVFVLFALPYLFIAVAMAAPRAGYRGTARHP
ncbi:MFS transporter [Hoyosella subflava]|uniref:Major facilitator superfamily MFS_1 n=1 Tax=Hoyosella subflava (strain DSM 45089 / JCM 17490 / NBRC 109087 / DQS3-9A1) TaxID=443218 RepID=F6EFN7_HOYSD|nr:MFS transporter [Hoyosella subflava]AEF40966.1 Major facilitator superfamily MFS_1 [Hoyosella subflava DQS3-9A1]